VVGDHAAAAACLLRPENNDGRRAERRGNGRRHRRGAQPRDGADERTADAPGCGAAPPSRRGADPAQRATRGHPGLSAEAEATLDRAADQSRADARHREVGAFFPVRIEAPPDASPTPAQEAAGRLLIEREDEVCRAILSELLASYRQYYEYEQGRFAAILAAEPDEASRARREALQRRYGLPAIAGAESLTAIAHLLKVQIPRSQIEGVSPLIIPVDCDWEQEHGLFLVYHPTLGAEWTCFDGLHEYVSLDDSATGGD
jgi:hypothetical protein